MSWTAAALDPAVSDCSIFAEDQWPSERQDPPTARQPGKGLRSHRASRTRGNSKHMPVFLFVLKLNPTEQNILSLIHLRSNTSYRSACIPCTGLILPQHFIFRRTCLTTTARNKELRYLGYGPASVWNSSPPQKKKEKKKPKSLETLLAGHSTNSQSVVWFTPASTLAEAPLLFHKPCFTHFLSKKNLCLCFLA